MVRQSLSVVFIHGFGSSARTWSSFIELITADDDLRHVAIHTFEYASPLVGLNPMRRTPNFSDIADSLRTFLAHKLEAAPPVVLVSHSQGGLVVQRYLARTLADGRGMELARIRRIVMFACPNSGSEFAATARRLAWLWRHPQERELRPLNEAITEAQRTVLNRVIHATEVAADQCPIPIVAYAGEQDGVVTPPSAKSVFPEVGVLPGDHTSIIRPDAPTHRSYLALKRELLAQPDSPDPVTPPTVVSRRARAGGGSDPAGGVDDGRAPAPPPAPVVKTEGNRDAEIVERLIAVPGMAEPEFRQQLYDLLPTAIVTQLRRNSVARMELFALVRTCDRFAHLDPWNGLVRALSDLLPGHPAVTALAALLADRDLL